MTFIIKCLAMPYTTTGCHGTLVVWFDYVVGEGGQEAGRGSGERERERQREEGREREREGRRGEGDREIHSHPPAL